MKLKLVVILLLMDLKKSLEILLFLERIILCVLLEVHFKIEEIILLTMQLISKVVIMFIDHKVYFLYIHKIKQFI